MSLTRGVHRSLQQRPNAPALIHGEATWTFQELADRVARLAAGLKTLGLKAGDPLGIISQNTTTFVEYALVCPWGGFVATPINYRWTVDEISYQLADSDTSVLLVDAESAERARSLRRSHPHLTLISADSSLVADGFIDYEDLISQSGPMEDSRPESNTLAGILYTGGTTGRPKGVMLTHGQIAASCLGALASSGSSNLPQRILHVGPLYHLAALGAFYQHVMIGSTHVVTDDLSIEGIASAISAHRVSTTSLVPTMIQRLVQYVAESSCDLSSLVSLSYGAAPISAPVLQSVMEILPDLQLSQRYGMTELAPIATILRAEDHLDSSHPERRRSVGRAGIHTEIRVIDADNNELAPGEIGEVIVRGDNVMLGYWNRPLETKAVLRDGWMHTGDAGHLDVDGYLYLVDRLKDMIVTGGENVYSAEVEMVLATHEAVAACAVIGLPDADWGERVHAVIVVHAGKSVTTAELREFCASSIARYKAPRSIEFVDQLPLSAVGKVLKRALRDERIVAPTDA